MPYLPEWLITAHGVFFLVNIAGCVDPHGFFAPKTLHRLRLIRACWIVSAFVTLIATMLGTIMFFETNPPLLLCFESGTAYFLFCGFFFVSMIGNYYALFKQKRTFIADEEERLRQSRTQQQQLIPDKREGVDLFEASLDYLVYVYGFSEAEIEEVRNRACDCVPCLPIDALEDHIGKLGLKGDDNQTAHRFIQDFLGQLDEAHREFEEHQNRCADIGFSPVLQHRLAVAIEEKKKGA